MKNEDIICISSIDWDFIWQGHQEIMSTLARDGNRVLFIENTGVRPPNLQDLPRLKKRIYNWFHSVKGIRKEAENLYIYSPLILPFPYSRIARWINRHLVISVLERWIKSVGFSNPIVWTFLPTSLVLDIIDAINSKLVIYYCIDNFAASSPNAKKIKSAERRLLTKADLVFVTAKNLYDAAAPYNKNVHLFPFGVNLNVYEKVRSGPRMVPTDIIAVKRPIIGYVGGVHKWIDFDLIKFLAKTNLDKSFVLVGPLQRKVEDLRGLPNIHFLGTKKYGDLPGYVSNFDVCIIPYMITEYTKNVYPTKLNEYLSLGKPVVSTKLPEIEAFNNRNGNIVYVAQTKEEFSDLIRRSLAESHEGDLYERRRVVAEKEGSWKVKIEKMLELIDEKSAAKEQERSVKWKDNILGFYKRSKKRIVLAIAVALTTYLILFETPLLWMVARPLKISDPPESSDAIVVFAGGVGESGKAGQGYEERVEYATELYKKGFSRHLVFSSGFKYFIKEADIMKALAISLGIPEDAIILEDNAVNTYENVVYAKRILDEKGWRKIILISSPYHMYRVSLVFKKNASDIKVIYAPIPYSVFYGNESKIEPKHIKAILHEYIAILYYLAKRYI